MQKITEQKILVGALILILTGGLVFSVFLLLQSAHTDGYISGFYYGANYGFGEALAVYNQSLKSEATYVIALGYESIKQDGNRSEFNLTDDTYLLTEITPESDRLYVQKRD